MKRILAAVWVASAALATVLACSDDKASPGPGRTSSSSSSSSGSIQPGGDSGATTKTVTLRFRALVGSTAFECGNKTFGGLGTANSTATVGDLRFFVHNVRLAKAGQTPVEVKLDDAEPWQGSNLGLIDFENKAGGCEFGTSGTNDVLRGTVTAGDYDTVLFDIGVPDSLNHVNVEQSRAPLLASKLQWNWTTGFIHFAAQANSTTVLDAGADAAYDAGPQRAASFFSHIGSTQCTGDPADGGTASCARKNRPSIRLSSFDVDRDVVAIDLARLWESSNIDFNTPGTIPGCMSGPSDPECPQVFTKLGLDFATGAVSDAGQRVFFVQAR